MTGLTPLLFANAFKVQDMMVTWMVGKDKRFCDKVADYDSGKIATTPVLFQQRPTLATAFWETYKALIPTRNVITHRGGMSVTSDGEITVLAAKGTTRITPDELCAYCRSMLKLVGHFSAATPLTAYDEALVEADLGALGSHHQQPVTTNSAALLDLSLEVPDTFLSSTAPPKWTIDLQRLAPKLHAMCGLGPSDSLFVEMSLSLWDTSQSYSMSVPQREMPTGVLEIGAPGGQAVILAEHP
ncbi:MAG: hypothetical protein KC731_23060 [Myxococcales bacterium]|nr:hypothetical protein [Myxococcales bacterium]